MFVDGGGSSNYDEKKKSAIPKFKNLLPKHAVATPLAAAAWIIDLLFAFWIYSTMLGWIHGTLNFFLFSPSLSMSANWPAFPGIFSAFLATLLTGHTMINFIFVGTPALILTLVAVNARNSKSSCPVCKRGNSKNYVVCAKCDYMFMTRDMMDREILSVKLNNLDYTPADVRKEFLERRLCDLTPKYIKRVLVKAHFL